MRTIPPYLLALFLASALILNDYHSNIVRYVTFTQNWLYVEDAPVLFPVGWSLSIEEWFYIVFPLFVYILF